MFILSSFYFLFTILFILILLYNQHTKVLSKNINTVQFFLHRSVYSISFLIIWLLVIQENPLLNTVSIPLIIFSSLVSFGILLSVEALKHVKNNIVILILVIGYLIYSMLLENVNQFFHGIILGASLLFGLLSIIYFAKNIKNRIGVTCTALAILCFNIAFYCFPKEVYTDSFTSTALYIESALVTLSFLFAVLTRTKFREVVTSSEFNFFYLGLLSISIYVCLASINAQQFSKNSYFSVLYFIIIFIIITFLSDKEKLDRKENYGVLFFVISLIMFFIHDGNSILFH